MNAPANAATAGASSSSRPRTGRPSPKSGPLRALPEGVARYEFLPLVGPEGEPRAEQANFVLTGAARGLEDAATVTVLSEAAGPSGRFAIESLPEPPGGDWTGAAPKGFAALPSAGVGPGGLPRRMRAEQDGMTVCLVPAGIVRLGSPEAGEERPRVFVSAFYMDRHEVTVGQYRAFMEATSERTPPPTNIDADADLPALGLPWRSAFLYAQWAGRALPTEAEWVRAARGDDDFRYPWGNAQPVFGSSRDSGQIDPVMSFRMDRSPFGVFDLAGNAGEWAVQSFADDPLRGERTDDSGLYRNPDRGSGAGGMKTVLGLGDGWTPDRRVGRDSQDGVERVGFRCVFRLTVDGTPGGDPLPLVTEGAGT
ncbi:Serine/threonine-protein kinase pkn1 [Alienimonas californiensis]|uniref:Serine/threonine-protein kinase pkn1 n=1 Tax=Alienimonas californiensis TaxID=2527989 RepID=A0A517PDF5_9PLAN|nr:Serine/threonine-protein kinase pkn1 [Alienimonas californiensis]